MSARKIKKVSLLKIFAFLCAPLWLTFSLPINLHAQSGRDDSQVAAQYLQWIRQAAEEGRWDDASAGIRRALDFADVSSDISYLYALILDQEREKRSYIIEVLNRAIETNRWENYNENHALLLKAEHLFALRDYIGVIGCVDLIENRTAPGDVSIRTEAAMLRLRAMQRLANNPANVNELTQFRSLVLTTMDRFPRDPRPPRIFFEYARNRRPELSDMPDSDINLLELVLRRLPFLLQYDPELAFLAAPFNRDIEAARRLTASYRSGSLSANAENFFPHPASIPVVLNLGLIDDNTAIEELFAERENTPVNVLHVDVLNETYRLLRSEEGRVLFTQKLFSFSGIIRNDEDSDGIYESHAVYQNGNLTSFSVDIDQNRVINFSLSFLQGNMPTNANIILAGPGVPANVVWDRFPSLESVTWENGIFRFAPVDFHYAPVTFIEIGGSNTSSALLFPVIAHQYFTLTYQSILSHCTSLTRPSSEIEGAIETIYMDRGVLLQVIETLNNMQVSVTEFERGLPRIQHIDLDLDGRMETTRQFRRPPRDYVWQDMLDYRRLVASSESDWSGDGRHRTREVYQSDGSIVYYFDMDGSGQWTYSETRHPR